MREKLASRFYVKMEVNLINLLGAKPEIKVGFYA